MEIKVGQWAEHSISKRGIVSDIYTIKESMKEENVGKEIYAIDISEDKCRDLVYKEDIKAVPISQSELKPCPFCGGEGDIKKPYVGETIHYINCKKCDCRIDEYPSLDEAIKVWNERV